MLGVARGFSPHTSPVSLFIERVVEGGQERRIRVY